MADRIFTVTFTNVPPGERVWAYVCPPQSAISKAQRLWTDDGTLTIHLQGESAEFARTVEDLNGFVLVAFTRGRRPILTPLFGEADAEQNIRMEAPFQNDIQIPLVFWILHGDVNRQIRRIESSVLYGNAVLLDEGAGFSLAIAGTVDATASAPTNSLLASSSNTGGSDWSNLAVIVETINKIGATLTPSKEFDRNSVNVFLTDKINDKGKNGNCPEPMQGFKGNYCLALDHRAMDDLLVHEIGHLLALPDLEPDDFPRTCKPTGKFNPYNIMRFKAYQRLYFTEGQIARMHFCATSAIMERFAQPNLPGTANWYTSAECDRLNISLSLAEDHCRFAGIPIERPELRPGDSQARVDWLIPASRIRYAMQERQRLTNGNIYAYQPQNLPAQHRTLEEYVADDIVRLLG